MSDSEPDTDLLDFLRQHLLKTSLSTPSSTDTKVLSSAEYIYNNSIDVALDMSSCKKAAQMIHNQMQQKEYSTKTWSSHELHPKTKDEATVNFIFTMDLLNFSFWSEKSEDERFAVEYRGRKWTGYWSLVACLQRALDEDIPITSSDFWQNEIECTEEVLRHVFRSCTDEEIPLFHERVACLREAGQILYERFSCSPTALIESSSRSASQLVNTLASSFSCFNDTHSFSSKSSLRILKRAQIFVADIWAAFDGQDIGEFSDIDSITMFADYRIPQILNTLGCLWYSPALESKIRKKEMIEAGGSLEMQMRGCSIWCVELVRREIQRNHPKTKVNAILIDFFLYDTMKEWEKEGKEPIPHHRTRSIWY